MKEVDILNNAILYWMVFFIIMFLYTLALVKYLWIKNKARGIRNIESIQYKICTDIDYIIYKLSASYNSKYVKKAIYEKITRNEGLLIFYGVNFLTFGSGDKNIGVTYQVSLIEHETMVEMRLKYLRSEKWNGYKPSVLYNRAFHLFLLEQLEIESFQIKEEMFGKANLS